MKKLLISCSLLLLFANIIFAQKLQKGWDLLNQNNRKEAKEFFEKAVNEPATKAEAALALSIMNRFESKPTEAFKYFKTFFENTDEPYAYAFALWSTGCLNINYGKKTDEQLAFLQKVIADPKANGTMKAMANQMLGYHYENANQLKKAVEEHKKQMAITQWQFLGTFDNTSASGFNKNFGAVEKPQADAVFKNKVNAKVGWQTIPVIREDNWVDFSFQFSLNSSIIYAQTYVNSPTDQTVYLRAGVSGSLKVWLNDKVVIAEKEERNNDLDNYATKVKLTQGYNRILVQVGKSEVNRANFMLRITDENAMPINGLTYMSSYQAYKKDNTTDTNSIAFFAEDYFVKKLAKSPDNFIDLMMLAEIYMRNDKVYDARKILQKLKDANPKSTIIGQLLIDAYDKDDNNTDLTKEQGRIKLDDPESMYAIKLLIDEAYNKEDYDEVETLLHKLEDNYGKTVYTELVNINLLSQRKQYDKLIQVINNAYVKYPDVYDFVSLKYAVESNGSKDIGAGNAVLKKYLKNNYRDRSLTQLADNSIKLGNSAEGFKIYTKRVTDYPYATQYYNDLSDLYLGKQDYENAVKWQLQVTEIAPTHGSSWNTLGNIYMSMEGKEVEAKNAYNKAIYFDPTDYDARKQLRKLEGKKELFEKFKKVNAVEIFKKSPKAEDFPEDNSIILLNEMERIVYPEGATEEKSELVIKVFNQAGIDTWKEYSVSYNGYSQRLIVDKAEVFKADGSKVQAETRDNYFVFTALEPGDAIHMLYKIESYYSGKLSEHFWDKFTFNYFFPAGLTRYSLILPKDKKFKYQMINADNKPEESEFDDFKMYVWEQNNKPALKQESYAPPLADIGIALEISSIEDWNYIANWYADLSESKSEANYEVKETVANLFKNKTGLSQLEKAKIIYNYIESNISYSSIAFLQSSHVPKKAASTLNTKLGDCKDLSTLFVSMAKEVGIEANLILVNTRNNGDSDMVLPSINFNHCIAYAVLDKQPYYIELTSQKLSFGTLGNNLLHAKSLFIPKNTKTTSTLLPIKDSKRALNAIWRETNLTFDNNVLNAKRTSYRSGVFAEGTRSTYADIGKEKQEKEMLESLSSDFTNTVTLTSLSFSDLKTLNDTVSYNYVFNTKNVFTDVAGLKIFRMPWTDAYRAVDFVSTDTRNYAFNMWELTDAETVKEQITIEYPKGKLLADVPKNVKLNCKGIDYSITYKVLPNKLVAVRELKCKDVIITPKDYAEFKEFFNKISENDSLQIGFK
ncbi:MAG: DUF3857 domain-containing protein [Bacteroidota bacterium]